MLHTALLVVVAVAVSMLLSSLEGFVEANFTQLGATARDMADMARSRDTGRTDPEEVFRVLEGFQLRIRWLYRPMTAMCVGLVVGLLGRRAPRRVAALAILPFLLGVCEREGWDLIGVALSAVYLGLTLLVVHLALMWRGHGATNEAEARVGSG